MSHKARRKLPPQGVVSKNPPPISNPNQQIVRMIVQQVRAEMFAGPLPRPEDLQKYNDILPGSAERILRMAEEQGAHRRTLESTALRDDIAGARRGSIFAFVITLTMIVAGALLIFEGRQITGTIFGGVGIAGVAGVFIYGSRQRRRERETKYGIPAPK